MAKAAQTTAGMDKVEIRKHIVLARRAPVHIAFALDGDGKAIVMMDKRKPPRAIERELKEQSADAKNHRFGMLSLDSDNRKCARIVINKPGAGMARKLVKAMKGTGVRQVEILLEDGSAVETAASEEDEEDTGQNDIDQDSAGEDRGEQDSADQDQVDYGDGGGNQMQSSAAGTELDGPKNAKQLPKEELSAPAQPDMATLMAGLTRAVKDVMVVVGRDPSKKAELAALATKVQLSIKRNDLAQAAADLDALRSAVGSASEAATPAQTRQSQDAGSAQAMSAGEAALRRYRKSRTVWMATRAKVDADIQKLSEFIMSIDHNGAFGDDLEQNFLAVVDPVLSTLDDSLTGYLTEAEHAKNEETVKRALTQARSTIDLFQKFVAANKTIKELDSNPFMPIAVASTLTTSLSALAAALR